MNALWRVNVEHCVWIPMHKWSTRRQYITLSHRISCQPQFLPHPNSHGFSKEQFNRVRCEIVERTNNKLKITYIHSLDKLADTTKTEAKAEYDSNRDQRVLLRQLRGFFFCLFSFSFNFINTTRRLFFFPLLLPCFLIVPFARRWLKVFLHVI